MRAALRWLRNEPLLYFLLFGAAIFVAYQRLNDAAVQTPGTIVVTPSRIESLAHGFALTWKRPPNANELDDLIESYVREEVFVREAIALGLDQDDLIIRRRLQQKLEFVSEDLVTRAEPTEEQLRAWFDAHAERFRVAPVVAFTHVYLNPQRRGDALAADLLAVREQLQRAGDTNEPSSAGDPFLLETTFEALPISEAQQLFGNQFASALAELPLGEWRGPIESGYGVHLVRVRGRSGGEVASFEAVREEVRREWLDDQRVTGNAKVYEALRKRYQVRIQKPDVAKRELAAAARR